MTTNPRDTDAHDAPPESGRASELDAPAPRGRSQEEADPHTTEDAVGTEGKPVAAAPWNKGFLAETVAASGLLVLLGLLAGVRVLEVLPSLLAQSHEGAIAGILFSEMIGALIAVLFGAVALALANAATRTWVRWVAPATIIVGLILAATAGGAYIQVPEPQPQAPMMPGS